MYRFGDGSPFPLEENFLETVVDAVTASAAVFTAAVDIEQARDKAAASRREAEEEVARLAQLERSVDQAVTLYLPSNERAASSTQQAAHKVLSQSKQSIAAARKDLEHQIQIFAAPPKNDPHQQKAFAAMAHLFERRILPQTVWSLAWQPGRGEATAQVGRFRLVFDIAREGLWGAPVRIGSLASHLRMSLPKKKVFGEPRPSEVSLDRCMLTSYERSSRTQSLSFRDSNGKEAWKVTLADPDLAAPIASAVDPEGGAAGASMALGEGDIAAMVQLADLVDGALRDARERGRTLREVRFGEVSLAQLTDLAPIGQALLGQVAPLVREIRIRSRAPGELILKRDVGDGRREELFVPRQTLERQFAALPPEHRRHFDAAGLGRGDTVDLDADHSDFDEDTGVSAKPAMEAPAVRPLPLSSLRPSPTASSPGAVPIVAAGTLG